MRSIFVCLIMLHSLSGIGQVYGTYYSKDYPELQKIVLQENGTFYIIYQLQDIYQYNDTLSFGNYSVVNDEVIEFNSFHKEFPNSQTALFEMVVSEENGRSEDTLYFTIENEFEDKICKNTSDGRRAINYSIALDGNFVVSQNNKISQFSNEFRIAKKDLLFDFHLFVIPDNLYFYGYLPFKVLFSDIYYLKNTQSNIFNIKIPTLSVNYLSTKRMISEYVLLKNKRTLIWQGEEYKK